MRTKKCADGSSGGISLHPGGIDRGMISGIPSSLIMNLHGSAVVISSFGVSAVVAVSSLDAPRGT